MKICNQAISNFKFKAWGYEKICLPACGLDTSSDRSGFECSDSRCADSDNAAAGLDCFIDNIRVFSVDEKSFTMDFMLFEFFSFYRKKCSDADVKS